MENLPFHVLLLILGILFPLEDSSLSLHPELEWSGLGGQFLAPTGWDILSQSCNLYNLYLAIYRMGIMPQLCLFLPVFQDYGEKPVGCCI